MMRRSRPLSVFVSYKHVEGGPDADSYRQSVACLVVALRIRGIHVFFDSMIREGDHWSETIAAAMDKADLVLICFSKQAFDAVEHLPQADKWSFRFEIDEALRIRDKGTAGVFSISLDGSPVSLIGKLNARYAEIQNAALGPRPGRPVLADIAGVLKRLGTEANRLRIAGHSWRLVGCGCNPDAHFDAGELTKLFETLDSWRLDIARKKGDKIRAWVNGNVRLAVRGIVTVVAATLVLLAYWSLFHSVFPGAFDLLCAAGIITCLLVWTCARGCTRRRIFAALCPPPWSPGLSLLVSFVIVILLWILAPNR